MLNRLSLYISFLRICLLNLNLQRYKSAYQICMILHCETFFYIDYNKKKGCGSTCWVFNVQYGHVYSIHIYKLKNKILCIYNL